MAEDDKFNAFKKEYEDHVRPIFADLGFNYDFTPQTE